MNSNCERWEWDLLKSAAIWIFALLQLLWRMSWINFASANCFCPRARHSVCVYVWQWRVEFGECLRAKSTEIDPMHETRTPLITRTSTINRIWIRKDDYTLYFRCGNTSFDEYIPRLFGCWLAFPPEAHRDQRVVCCFFFLLYLSILRWNSFYVNRTLSRCHCCADVLTINTIEMEVSSPQMGSFSPGACTSAIR